MIVFENVSFGYKRGINVLSGFSLEVPDSGRVCLFGKSGCGKSTVLRLAMGLAKPGSGRITGTEGIAVSAVFQEDRLIPWKRQQVSRTAWQQVRRAARMPAEMRPQFLQTAQLTICARWDSATCSAAFPMNCRAA